MGLKEKKKTNGEHLPFFSLFFFVSLSLFMMSSKKCLHKMCKVVNKKCILDMHGGQKEEENQPSVRIYCMNERTNERNGRKQ